MQLKQLLTSIFFLAIISNPANAQEDFRLDFDFFKSQEVTYQRWLEDAGLSKVLRVKEVEVDSDLVSLYLAFNYTDIDSMYNAWNQLKAEFDKKQEVTLEQQLFYKFTHIFDLNELDGNVQIYDSYVNEKFCLFWGMEFKNGSVKIHHEFPCNKAAKVFSLDPTDFSKTKEISADSIKNYLPKYKVFNTILEYARERFEKATCKDRDPVIRIRENKEVLRFEADDLCKEVLIDETNSVLCRIANRLRFDCNTISRERLNFTITYEQTSEGFQITCEIDGKYARGYLGKKPRRSDYKDMEEGEYKEYLELFADLLVQDLRKVLVQL